MTHTKNFGAIISLSYGKLCGGMVFRDPVIAFSLSSCLFEVSTDS